MSSKLLRLSHRCALHSTHKVPFCCLGNSHQQRTLPKSLVKSIFFLLSKRNKFPPQMKSWFSYPICKHWGKRRRDLRVKCDVTNWIVFISKPFLPTRWFVCLISTQNCIRERRAAHARLGNRFSISTSKCTRRRSEHTFERAMHRERENQFACTTSSFFLPSHILRS